MIKNEIIKEQNNPKDESSKEQQTQKKSEVFISPKDNITSRVEISFTFKDQGNQPDDSTKSDASTKMHEHIQIQNTPTLYLDISNEEKEKQIIYDSLKFENNSLNSTLTKCDAHMKNLLTENENLKNELISLKNEYILQTHQMNAIKETLAKNEMAYINQYKLHKHQLEQNDLEIKKLVNLFNEIEKQHQNKNKDEKVSRDDYLSLKFSMEKNDDAFLINALSKDLIDFAKLKKVIREEKKNYINKILCQIKEVTNSLNINCEIKIYGSFATQLSLEKSGLDLVIILQDDDFTLNFSKANYMSLIHTISLKLKNLSWVYSINIIEEMVYLPKIKIECNEQANSLTCFICIVNNQIASNSLLKTTEIINNYSKKYENILIPLVLALKEVLYNGNLISNYPANNNSAGGICSYALTIMLINYLNSKEEDISKGATLGSLFLELIKHFGNFNNSQRIYYINDPSEINPQVIQYYANQIQNANCEIAVIDPCEMKNNLTEKTFKFENIKLTLMIGYFIAKDSCECSCHYAPDSNSSSVEKEHCVLNKIFKTVKRFTDQSNSF